MNEQINTTKQNNTINKKNKNENKEIIIKNASHNNLKNVNVNIPRNKLTLITGVSGSGKSTLAFDTLYAEGQRRFVESLSSYARQFLERMAKPEVEAIIGLPPAVAIEQKSPPRNPRSTVGTTTEIYDYIRALFARIGITYCACCGKQIAADNPTSIAKKIMEWNKDDKIYILFALKSSVVNVASELERLGKVGFARVVGKNSNDVIDYSELKLSIKTRYDDYFILVDRIVLSDEKDTVTRLIDSLEVANNASDGRITVRNLTQNTEVKFSSIYECADCDIKYETPEPKLFAFNSPKGACPTCQGLGIYFGIDEKLIIPDESLSIEDQCVHPYRTTATISVQRELINTAKKYNIPTDVPYCELTQIQKDFIWDGKDNYFGINGYFKFLDTKSYKIQNRYVLAKYQGMTTCMKCGGSRLKQSARQVYVYGKNIPELANMQMSELYDYVENLPLTKYEQSASEQIIFELKARIKMLLDIGLDYLTLSRSCQTLSGGEYQRINLSTALGSALVGTLYVLDEPSIGMHPKDTDRLLQILFKLKSLGNTIVVVEHDPEIISKADFIIDMGVGAGNSGGNIVSAGSFDNLLKSKESLTAMYFNKKKTIEIPQNRRQPTENKITISGARENNLKIDKLSIPLGCLTVITGVSGSGKSSLVHNTLYSGVMHAWGKPLKDKALGKFDLIDGVDFVDGIELVDQTPIGKSSRSTPATYIKVFDCIRDLYAQTQAAKQLGLKSGYFSFNIPGGRCEVCEGDGYVNIDMQFLPDIKVVCETCNGDRYKKEVREILYNGKNIIDVLEMSVDEAFEHFTGITRIENKLKIMQDVGLGYLKLGQPSSALSGGEAQRIKLASHIDSSDNSNILYIFDEPTTGLHLDDISKLINAINKLVDAGNSVLIIEHNLHIISIADWIIDLGPDAGNRGGKVVGEGTPEQIATKNTHTGIALKEFLATNSK